MTDYSNFSSLDIRVGTIIDVLDFPKAKKKAYRLKIDFGENIGCKNSSAQITELYSKDQLIGKQILAVINFPARQIANFISEVLVLGIYTQNGVALIVPDQVAKNGDKLG